MAQSFNRAIHDKPANRVAFGSVGVGYGTLLSSTSKVRKLVIDNTLNQDVVLSLDGGTTDYCYLSAGRSLILDFDISLEYSGTVSVKHAGTAPTAGNISAGVSRGGV